MVPASPLVPLVSQQKESDPVRCEVSLKTSGCDLAKLSFYYYEAILLQKM